MARKLKYKEVSEEYNKMGSPSDGSSARYGAGLDQSLGEYYYIKIEDLIPFHNQARKSFNQEEIQGLSESIKLCGVRQPLTIISSKIDCEKYEVISGERRLKAAILAGLNKVPCIIINETLQPDAVALIENVHREDLHPLELMTSYQNLLAKGIFSSVSEISSKTGISRTTITETIGLSQLPADTQNILLEKQLKTRSLLRALVKTPQKEHEEIIKMFEEGKQSSKVRKKKIFEPKIKVLNIIHHANNFCIENNRLEQLTQQQKYEIKNLLLSIVEKL